MVLNIKPVLNETCNLMRRRTVNEFSFRSLSIGYRSVLPRFLVSRGLKMIPPFLSKRTYLRKLIDICLPIRVSLPDQNFAYVRYGTTDLYVAQEIYGKNCYDQLFSPEAGDVVIDVGAHIGLYSLKCAKKVGRKGYIISIEPEPTNYCLLCRNILTNGVKNIIPINVALSDYEGFHRLSLDEWNTGAHSMINKRGSSSIIVRVNTLDNIISRIGLGEVNFIKIDAEGSELAILKGGRQVLNSKGIKVVISAEHYEGEAMEIASYLQTKGFAVHVMNDQYVYATARF